MNKSHERLIADQNPTPPFGPFLATLYSTLSGSRSMWTETLTPTPTFSSEPLAPASSGNHHQHPISSSVPISPPFATSIFLHRLSTRFSRCRTPVSRQSAKPLCGIASCADIHHKINQPIADCDVEILDSCLYLCFIASRPCWWFSNFSSIFSDFPSNLVSKRDTPLKTSNPAAPTSLTSQLDSRPGQPTSQSRICLNRLIC